MKILVPDRGLNVTLKELTEPQLRETSAYLYMELARLAATHFITMTEIEKCVDLNLEENRTLREYVDLGIYHLQQMNQRLGNFQENVALMLDAAEKQWGGGVVLTKSRLKYRERT